MYRGNANAMPQQMHVAAFSPKSCTPPSDWEEGEKWAQGAHAGAGSKTSGSVERRFRAEKGVQSSYYTDPQGNCVYISDANVRSVR